MEALQEHLYSFRQTIWDKFVSEKTIRIVSSSDELAPNGIDMR